VNAPLALSGQLIRTTAGVHLLVLALWLAAFLIAALLEYAPHASLWFPPAAVTFAALMVLGARILPTLWAACLIATVLTDRMYAQELTTQALLVSGVLFALGHTAAYGLIAIPLRAMAWDSSPVTTVRKVTIFLIGGGIAAGLAALLGSTGLALSGMIERGEVTSLIVPWWIGDYAGLLTLGPVIALLLVRLAGDQFPIGAQPFTRPEHGEALGSRLAGKLIILLGTTMLILGASALAPHNETLVFLMFFTVVIQLWIVHTEPEAGALAGIVLVSFAVVLATWMFELGHQALILQFVLITLAANSYFGLAVPSLYSDNRRLRKLLTHDTLTGALSRFFFEDGTRAGIETARQRREPAVLIMVDLDRLKQINDRHGHAAGDRALELLAKSCRQALKAGEMMGRLSGDEFAIFLPRTTASAAGTVVTAIRSALADAPPIADTERIQASFGVAELTDETPDYERLLAKADQAMYHDKIRG
jgi:diguanylate cyclase (GGDEF)-like protein